MEINITHMIKDADDMPLLSGSVAELGNGAGQLTWNNSKTYAAEHPLLTTDAELEEARDYFKQFGAWDEEERNAWSAEEINAMLVQDIASNIREMERFDSYEEYIEAAKKGQVDGTIYKADSNQYYFYMGF